MNKPKETTYAINKKEYARNFKRIVAAKSNEHHSAEICENCGATLDMEYHHVLPLRFKGTNELSNIKRLCKKCHSNVHHGFKTSDKYMENDPFVGIQLEALFPEFLHLNCDSCKSQNNLKMRMVVPFSVGGQYTKGNLATFCKSCNNILERNTNEKGILNHSALIKIGIESARNSGVTFGRPTTDKKINNAVIAIYLRGLKVKEASEIFDFKVSTLYKYKRDFDKLYIFEKLNNNEFNLLDAKTGVLIRHFNLLEHAA